MAMPRRCYVSSDGRECNLVFTPEDEDLYNAFEKEKINVNLRYAALLRERHGFWASNQNAYVEKLSDLDPRLDGSKHEKNIVEWIKPFVDTLDKLSKPDREKFLLNLNCASMEKYK